MKDLLWILILILAILFFLMFDPMVKESMPGLKHGPMSKTNCRHTAKNGPVVNGYNIRSKRNCGHTPAQLNQTRGKLIPTDNEHLYQTTYSMPDNGDHVEFCKNKCEENPRCGSFVTNMQTKQCHINEKLDNSKIICNNTETSDTYIRDNTQCEHEKMQHWYCQKDFGHRYWN